MKLQSKIACRKALTRDARAKKNQTRNEKDIFTHMGHLIGKSFLSLSMLTVALQGCGGGTTEVPISNVQPTARVESSVPDLGGPTGVFGNTLCLNADPTNIAPLYTRIESVLGPNSIESPSDAVYAPPIAHIAERADGFGGAYLVFLAIEPTDINTSEPQDRSRTEIKISPATSGPHTNFQAHENDEFLYSWRFFIPATVKFSKSFTHLHQLLAHGGPYADAAIVTFTLSNGKLVVRHIGDKVTDTSQFTSLATLPIDQIQGRWVTVREEVKFSNMDGYYRLHMDVAGQSLPVISIDTRPLSMWRSGSDHARAKWGVYRKHSTELNQNSADEFWFSNLAVSRGVIADSTCRRTL